MRTRLLAALLPGPQPHRGSPLEDKAPPKEDLCPHQGGSDRGDGSSTGSREYRRRTRFLRSLRLLHPGAAAMKDAVTTLYELTTHQRFASPPNYTNSRND